MYHINNQKHFLNRLMPSNKISCEKEVIYQKSGFRDLLKKRKNIFFLLIFIYWLIIFGISKSSYLISCLIVRNTFIMIFLNSFGEKIRNIFNMKRTENAIPNYPLNQLLINL